MGNLADEVLQSAKPALPPAQAPGQKQGQLTLGIFCLASESD